MLKIDAIGVAAAPAANETAKEAHDETIMQRAKEFESIFVAQMLKHSGFEKALSSESGFGGESYASLLLERYAANIVDNGGFGLAEKIYEQLVSKESGHAPDRIV